MEATPYPQRKQISARDTQAPGNMTQCHSCPCLTFLMARPRVTSLKQQAYLLKPLHLRSDTQPFCSHLSTTPF